MKLAHRLLRAYTGVLLGVGGYLARKLHHSFYLLLAGVFTVVLVLDVLFVRAIVDMRHRGYDLAVKNRIVVPEPDPDIVIVDIDEASLAALAKDYGRWPWPRQVFGEFLEQLQAQRPQAVVFDILFSDADVFNPDSDAYFNEVVAGTGNTYFPLLRLPAANDALSQLRPSMVPGLKPMPGAQPEDRPVALVLPFFKAAVDSGRFGAHNILPDSDGVARAYPVHHDVHGWRIPSLPARVAEGLGWPVPERGEILLNWRGPPFTYRSVSFADVYLDMLRKERQRPADEFKGKVVIIGSTAPSLFDIKATSVARQFPGVEILATAIDNLKHDDHIRVPASRWPVFLATLLLLWGTAWALFRNVEPERFARLFGFSQVGLLALSYLTISFTNFYLNLAGPVLLVFAYFSVAKLYAYATAKALERNVVAQTLREGASVVATMAVFDFQAADELALPAFLRALKKEVERTGTLPKDVEMLRGSQRGIWGVLDNLLVVSWACAADDAAAQAAITLEAQALARRMPELVGASRVAGESLQGHVVHTLALGTGGQHPTESDWREIFAQTLEKLRTS